LHGYSITSSARAKASAARRGRVPFRHDQVNDELELGRLLDRNIGGLRPANLVDQVAGAPLKSMKATVPTGVENSYFS
jgi:hypothetical protein